MTHAIEGRGRGKAALKTGEARLRRGSGDFGLGFFGGDICWDMLGYIYIYIVNNLVGG